MRPSVDQVPPIGDAPAATAVSEMNAGSENVWVKAVEQKRRRIKVTMKTLDSARITLRKVQLTYYCAEIVNS